MMKNSLYADAHLFVAAIRVLEHRHAAPPNLDEICRMLSISVDEANRLSRKLSGLGVVEAVAKADEIRLFIRDHRRIEEIPEQPYTSSMSADLEKFQQKKAAERKTLDDIRSSQEQKRKKVQEEIEQKLKAQMAKKSDQ